MAKKKKLFKQISNVHLEAIPDGEWNSFLRLEKQDPSMRSAYIDKVRISWVMGTDEGSDNSQNAALFVASHDVALDSSTPSNNDGNIICSGASRGPGGVTTLDIKRRVTTNYEGTDVDIRSLLEGTTGAPVYLHVRRANTGQAASLYLVIEIYGRWFSAESL